MPADAPHRGVDKYCSPAAQEQIIAALSGDAAIHVYPNSDHAFARKGGMHYDPGPPSSPISAPSISLLRTSHRQAAFARSHLGRTHRARIRNTSTEDTLATMVEDAYVNHIPVLTGGVGKGQLREFYSKHFIPHMPPDTTLTPISRTIGDHQIVDEMIFRFQPAQARRRHQS